MDGGQRNWEDRQKVRGKHKTDPSLALSGKAWPCQHPDLRLPAPKRSDNAFLLFKPPNVRYFVTIAPGIHLWNGLRLVLVGVRFCRPAFFTVVSTADHLWPLWMIESRNSRPQKMEDWARPDGHFREDLHQKYWLWGSKECHKAKNAEMTKL